MCRVCSAKCRDDDECWTASYLEANCFGLVYSLCTLFCLEKLWKRMRNSARVVVIPGQILTWYLCNTSQWRYKLDQAPRSESILFLVHLCYIYTWECVQGFKIISVMASHLSGFKWWTRESVKRNNLCLF